MTRYPLFGLLTAILGALLLSPDTLLMRWAEMDGFHMLAWRGLLAGSIFITLWFITRQGRRAEDIANLKRPFGLGLITCQFFNATLFSLGVSIAPVALVLLGVATVTIFDARGAEVLQSMTEGLVSLSGMSAGRYTVRIATARGISMLPLVIE